MSDDGTATDISIPTLLIQFRDGRDLLDQLEDNSEVMVTLLAEFSLNKYNHVNY